MLFISRYVGLTSILLTITLLSKTQFAKYRPVEAFEIRPGILMMPKYAKDGRVCEIGIEKLHYDREKISLDSALSPQMIDEISDELAPSEERGQRTAGPGTKGIILQAGHSNITIADYENISIQSYANGPADSVDLVTVIRWKNRGCK